MDGIDACFQVDTNKNIMHSNIRVKYVIYYKLLPITFSGTETFLKGSKRKLMIKDEASPDGPLFMHGVGDRSFTHNIHLGSKLFHTGLNP